MEGGRDREHTLPPMIGDKPSRTSPKGPPRVTCCSSWRPERPHMAVDVEALGCASSPFRYTRCGPPGLVCSGPAQGSSKRWTRSSAARNDSLVRKGSLGHVPTSRSRPPNIAEVIAFSAALKNLAELGMDNVRAHESRSAYALDRCSASTEFQSRPARYGEARGAVRLRSKVCIPRCQPIVDSSEGRSERAIMAQLLLRRLAGTATNRAASTSTHRARVTATDAIKQAQKVFNRAGSRTAV